MPCGILDRMAVATPTRRRWYQFSLRELFWLMVVMALIAFAIVQRRELAIARDQYSAVQRALVNVLTERDSYRDRFRKLELEMLYRPQRRALHAIDESGSAPSETAILTETPNRGDSEAKSDP